MKTLQYRVVYFGVMIFSIYSISSVAAETNPAWKTVGEYFESKYLNEYQSGNHKPDFLLQAFQTYQTYADRGDPDAQFRIAVLYDRSLPKQAEEALKLYRKAAALGHSIAGQRARGEMRNEVEECRLYSSLLLQPLTDASVVLGRIESLALLGQTQCMLALGQWFKNGPQPNGIRSLYWLQRAALTGRADQADGEALYELASSLSGTLGGNHLSVISLMERAAHFENRDARDWLEYNQCGDAKMAYASYLRDSDKAHLADFILNSLENEPATSAWAQSDQYKSIGTAEHRNRYQQNIGAALVTHKEGGAAFASAIIHDIALELGSNELSQGQRADFIDIGFELFDTLSFSSMETEARQDLISLLKLLKEETETAKFLSKMQTVATIYRTLSANERQPGLEAAINQALDEFFESVPKIEIVLNEVLNTVRESGRPDLMMLCFKRLFGNELEQLRLQMRLDDLAAGLSHGAKSNPSTFEFVEILASLQLPLNADSQTRDKSNSNDFAKLKILREAKLNLSDFEANLHSFLFMENILLLNEFFHAYKHHQASGSYFLGNSLAATLSYRHIEALKRTFESRLNTLSELSQEIRRNRENRENIADAQNIKMLTEASLEAQFKGKNEELKARLHELIATQKALDAQLRYSGRFGEAKANLLSSEGLRFFKHMPAENDYFAVSPADAKLSVDLAFLAKTPFHSHLSILLQKNEVLNIRVTGEWSPTCALSRSDLANGMQGAMVGPEGFRTHLSEGDTLNAGTDSRNTTSSFNTKSSSRSYGADWFKVGALVVGAVVGAATGGAGAIVAGMVVGSLASAPFSFSDSQSSTTGTSQTKETSEYHQTSSFKSNTASFQSGLRLAHTPFPAAPAGSYLAIAISRNHKNLGEVVGAFVIQPHDSFVAPEDCEVFFVVNDCNDGVARMGMLNVQLQRLKPTTPEIEKLIDQLETSLRVFADKGETLAREGGDLGSRIETLKGEFIAKLSRDSAVDFMAQPALRTSFLQYLNFESDKIVRKARILDLIRVVQTLHYEIAGLSQQLKIGGNQEAVLRSRTNRLLRAAEDIPLYMAVSDTVEHATKYLLPLLQLYFPNEVIHFSNNNIANSELEDVATHVKSLSRQVLDRLSKEWTATTAEDYLIVRVPRPGSNISSDESKLTPVVSPERAKILWDHLFAKERGTDLGLKLEFKDLYQDASQGRLVKRQESPIILDMALLFGVDDHFAVEHLQQQFSASTLDVLVERDQVFPQAKGPRTFVLSNDDLRSHKMSIGFINAKEFVTASMNHIRQDVAMNLNTAKGLSPFSIFSFGGESQGALEQIEDALGSDEDGYPKRLSNIFIVMKVVSTNRYEGMNWIK